MLPALIRRFHEAAEANVPNVTCWGTGSPLREFLHVDDLGKACVFALEHWSPAPGELTFLNVGTGVDLSIRELAEAVATATGYQGAIEWDSSKPDGTPKKQLDVSRLAALGWRAGIPLAEGLASTVAAFAPVATALSCADHAQDMAMARQSAERATERVAVLMTPTEKAAYADHASSLGLSLGQFFREAGASYVNRSTHRDEEEALEAALKQLEWSTRRAEQTLDEAIAEVRAALNAGS